MRYDLLDKEARDQMREQHRQRLTDELRVLEQRHYEAELEYRLASALEPPDETRKAAARAAQTATDVEYDARKPELDALNARRQGDGR